jgi:hypothetical protein
VGVREVIRCRLPGLHGPDHGNADADRKDEDDQIADMELRSDQHGVETAISYQQSAFSRSVLADC